MKKFKKSVFFGAFIVAFGAVALVACEKEGIENAGNSETFTENPDKNYLPTAGGGFCVDWEGWGHVERDTASAELGNCVGWGLCRFSITPHAIAVGGHATPIVYDAPTDSYYFDVYLDGTAPAGEDTSTLPIEHTSAVDPETGTIYSTVAGSYPLDMTLGAMGGYRIPIIVE